MLRRWRFPLATAACAVLLSGCAQAGATEQGREIHSLYGIIFVLAAFVFVLVEGILLWCIVRYRRRGDAAPPQTFGSSRALIAFFAFGAVMVSVLFPFGERTLAFVLRQDPSAAIDIRMEAFQWEWTAVYLNEGIFTTGRTLKEPMVMEIPVDEPVHVTLISRDVMHGFYVPAFLFMRNAIPGHPSTFTFTADKLGSFPGQCTEFCGLWHSKMTFMLKVVTATDYSAWVQDRTLKAIGGTCPPDGDALRLTAKDTSWNTNCLAVHVGAVFSVTVANLDQGVEHNFAIYPSLQDGIASSNELFETGKFPGVATKSYQVTAVQSLKPGHYYFQCNVHGVAMAGAFIVAK
jgi:cytochrome c oxidase subunit II